MFEVFYRFQSMVCLNRHRQGSAHSSTAQLFFLTSNLSQLFIFHKFSLLPAPQTFHRVITSPSSQSQKTGVIQAVLTHLCWSHNLPLPFLLLLLIQLSIYPNYFLSLFCFISPYISSSAWPVQVILSFSKLLVRPVN